MKRNRGRTMFNILLVSSFPSDLIEKGRCIGTADINGLTEMWRLRSWSSLNTCNAGNHRCLILNIPMMMSVEICR